MEYHYVYKITNNKPSDSRKYYIGVRSSNAKPEEDTKYRSSSSHLKKAIKEIGYEYFTKEILSIWETRDDANIEEIRLHELFSVSKNPEYYNKSNAISNGFCTQCRVNVIDTRDGNIKQITKQEFDNSENYIGHTTGLLAVFDTTTKTNKMVTKEEYTTCSNYVSTTKGRVNVLDTNTGLTKQVTKQEFDSNENYISTTKGWVTVIDIRDNSTKHVSKAEFENSTYYVSIAKGLIPVTDTRDGSIKKVTKEEFENNNFFISMFKNTIIVKDIRDNSFKRVSKEDFNKCDYFVSPTAKKIAIYKTDGTIFDVCCGDFRIFCIKHNLSVDALRESYRNNGKPIFTNITNVGFNRLKTRSREFQIGWYAKIID